jgi:hypothetical protein
MDKIITKYNYDLKKLYYDEQINIGDGRSKIKVFRSGEGFKYNRIFIKTPRIRLAFDPNKNRFNNITVSLHPLTEEIKEFYKFIKEIDKLNKKHIDKKFKYKSNIIKKKDSNFRYIQFNLSNSCKIFNNKRELTDISELSIKNDVRLLVELNHIWIKDNKCGASWDVYQIRFYPFLINLDNCFISSDEESETESTNNNKYKHIYKCLNCSTEKEIHNTNQHNINKEIKTNKSQNSVKKTDTKSNKKPVLSFRPPSVKDILNMRNKLKKSNHKALPI